MTLSSQLDCLFLKSLVESDVTTGSRHRFLHRFGGVFFFVTLRKLRASHLYCGGPIIYQASTVIVVLSIGFPSGNVLHENSTLIAHKDSQKVYTIYNKSEGKFTKK